MKRTWLLLIVAFAGMMACQETGTTNQPSAEIEEEIPFLGTWTRTFALNEDSMQYVYYRIGPDSIEYEMRGPLPVKYVMNMDSFVVEENRWTGLLNEVPYVIFVKDMTDSTITLFKQQVESLSVALAKPMPSTQDSSHFSSWNTYHWIE